MMVCKESCVLVFKSYQHKKNALTAQDGKAEYNRQRHAIAEKFQLRHKC